MKKKIIYFLPLFILTTAAGAASSRFAVSPNNKHYALFMYNYPRVTAISPNGFEESTENLLYVKEEITLGELINKPATDPEREGYEFKGWFKETACENEWNFASDLAQASTFLYAKWGLPEGGGGEYVEPEYTYPEDIITDANYRVTGILNVPVQDGVVKLTTGAIKRLEKHAENVSFAVNYERKADVSLTVATYDKDTQTIHLETSTSEEFDITVQDITATKRLVGFDYYEQKAQKYEANGEDIENYHIMLAGSSSMENWATSTEDMNPIVSYNHGIGGTTVEQWTDSLLERLVLPYSPKAVVYYVGVNNIINNGKDGQQTGNALVELFNKTHQYLPKTKIFYVLINKLPNFKQQQPEFDIANNIALQYEAQHDYLTCINAGIGLLKPNGDPHWGYFISDGLHMSKIGYVIWGAAVKEAIKHWLG